MPEFLLRTWAEQTLFDCNDYTVTADTLEAAVDLLTEVQGNIQDGVYPPLSHDAIAPEVTELDPSEVVNGNEGVTLVDAEGNRVRDLRGLPVGCVRLGKPLEPEAPATTRLKLWVLHISHKHGDSYWVFDDCDAAHARLASWARQWWDKDGPRDEQSQIVPMPEEDATVVEEYFGAREDEDWSIEEAGLNEG